MQTENRRRTGSHPVHVTGCLLLLGLCGWLAPAVAAQAGPVSFIGTTFKSISGGAGAGGSGPAMPTVVVIPAPFLNSVESETAFAPKGSAFESGRAHFGMELGAGVAVLTPGGGAKDLTLASGGGGGKYQASPATDWTLAGHLHADGLQGDNGEVRLSGVAVDAGLDVGFGLWHMQEAVPSDDVVDLKSAQAVRGLVGLSSSYLGLSGTAANGSGGRSKVHFEAVCLNLRLGAQYQLWLNNRWSLFPALLVSARVYTQQLTPRVSANVNEDFGDRLSGTLRCDLGYSPLPGAGRMQFGLGLTYAKNALAAQLGVAWQFY